ncbi:MAG: hypothetical protein ACJAWC_003001 [Yoonia sp.]|jgi:hypothetical protein
MGILMSRSLTLILCFALIGPSVASACELPSSWTRTGEPVLRDPILDQPYTYEVASDPHVFWTDTGQLVAVYTGDDDDAVSIKLSFGINDHGFRPGSVLLGPSAGHLSPKFKETPFYYQTPQGEHQIYFIGYENEETYETQVYFAVSDEVAGPYTIIPTPVMPRGNIADKEVHLITSPSVVKHDGLLHMMFLGWDAFEKVTQIWSMGAISADNGRTWHDAREVGVPIGMEGQVTAVLNGGFVATRTGEHNGREAVFVNCAEHPFGPFSQTETPVLSRAGAPWEVDEINIV